MKVKELVMKMYRACLDHDKVKELKLWKKVVKKSLKHKKTHVVK